MIKGSKIAARYTRALFDLAVAQGRLDEVYRDMEQLRPLLSGHSDLRNFIVHPTLPDSRKLDVIRAVFESRVDPLTYTFLRFLVQRGRLNYLPAMPALFDTYYDIEREQLKVDVVSAMPLTEKQQASLIARLKSRFKKNIVAHYEEDKRLIGGFRVHVNDTIYDFSLATMLDSFKRKIINA